MRGSTGLTGRAFRVLHLLCAVALVGLAAGPLSARIGLVAAAIPQPAHIVIVVEENRSEANIIGNKSAPFITALAASGANMVQSFAETHPSEPNYLAMFAGSTFGVTSDRCPVNAGDAPNLGSELLAAGYTFAGFAEGLPAVGSPACTAGKYARKHVPWANFTNVPPANSLPFSAFPMGNYASLPTVSFVIPNNDDNMHDGSIAQADTWLNRELSGYANWAVANNSLLIVTWDEDDNSSRNQIPTIFYGAHVVPGNYAERITHYNLLSTIEQMYGLPKTGYAAGAPPIADIWG
ncbi:MULTISPECIES: alkaline phosphatase family protein [unclassified Mycobacterium]|uniref:alkaline phosphatase family protein n=1 Tax=unclassified Mycobacterium TaxID=2642494 RepID=UPI0007FDDF43|nr:MULTISPECIES: alkaline phosphatase family protein [unclassified Mycobacterium]OBG58660.1 acid phosphatase [Mycobacterium sp. E188]OBH32502.1 acid phosphatase [Mycobacterium sp. E183]